MNRVVVLILVAIALAGALWGAVAWDLLPWMGAPQGGSPSAGMLETRDELLDENRIVVALGRLEPARGVVTVHAAAGDRVQTLEVAEGDVVVAGQSLGSLESRELGLTQLQLARSQLEEAQARRQAEEGLASARVTSARLAEQQAQGPHYELEAQRQQIDALQSGLQQTRLDLERLKNLSQELVSPQEIEHQQLLVRKQQTELEAARARLKSAEQTLQFNQQVATAERQAAEASREQVTQAIPVESLSKQVRLAELELQQSEITAPIGGTVLKILTQAGEATSQKPILQLADLTHMVCVAEVYETDVKYLRVGQTAIIHSRALGDDPQTAQLHGTVTSVGSMIMTPELRSLDPFAPVDRHVVEVRVDLDAQSTAKAARWVNLQVEVTFVRDRQVRETAHWSPEHRAPRRPL